MARIARPPGAEGPCQPLVVGIAGGSGSGKSTLAARVLAGLPPGTAAILEHDAYYRDRSELSAAARAALNYDHPEALDNDLLLSHLDGLRRGHAVDVPVYDFVSHSRRPQRRLLAPAPVLILEGILVFVDARLRQRLDVKLFVDTDADIRLMRRIRRDMQERGRAFANVREQYYRSVRPMHNQFVEPSKAWADLIIPEGGNNQVALALVLGHLGHVTGATAEPPAPRLVACDAAQSG